MALQPNFNFDVANRLAVAVGVSIILPSFRIHNASVSIRRRQKVSHVKVKANDGGRFPTLRDVRGQNLLSAILMGFVTLRSLSESTARPVFIYQRCILNNAAHLHVTPPPSTPLPIRSLCMRSVIQSAGIKDCWFSTQMSRRVVTFTGARYLA